METPITLQDQLFEEIKAIYSDAIPKKINTDNYLDVKIPSVITKKSAHLYFNSSKEKIKVGILFIDAELIEALIAKNDSLEKFSNGVRLVGNPSFSNVQDAINAAKELLDCINNITNNEQNNPTTQNKIIKDPIKNIEQSSVKTIDYSGIYLRLEEICKIVFKDNKLIVNGSMGNINAVLVNESKSLFEGIIVFRESTQKITLEYIEDKSRFDFKEYIKYDFDREPFLLEDYYEKIDEAYIENTISFPDDSIYYGNIKDGKPDGFGQMLYSNGDYYKGEFTIGDKNGYGTMQFSNGNEYNGNWEFENIEGAGTMKYLNGDIFEGNWIFNEKNGKGKMIYSNGDIYDGEWEFDVRDGNGKLTLENGEVQEGKFADDKFVESKIKVINYEGGDKFEGEIKDGKRHGKGKYTWSNGNVYVGDFVAGNRTGKGKYIRADGDVYEGDFVNGDFNGKGKKTWANGDVYEGDFVNGNWTGIGKYIWANGGVYVGDFVNGDFNGKGKKTYSNGNSYEGDWKDGKRHGNGKMIYASGDVYEGKWVDGERIGKTNFEIQKENALAEEKRKVDANRDRVIKGTFEYNIGTYEGEMMNGNFNGKGKMTYTNGEIYEGNWKDDKRHGNGKMTYANGNVYEGEWYKGEKHGQGKMKYSNGDFYQGGFDYGRATGYTKFEKEKELERVKKKEYPHFIDYRIKLKEEKGFIFKDKKGSYLKKSLVMYYVGDLPESKVKQYIMTNDKDILSGKAGSSTLIIDKIRKGS